MARQRGGAAGAGGPADLGFLARLRAQFRARAAAGARRQLPCESYFFRWEWLDAQGNRVASGVHSIIRPAGERRQAVAQRARAQVRALNARYLEALAQNYPGGRLQISRVEEPLAVSGPC